MTETADLTSTDLGVQPMHDDGLDGDAAAGDLVFSYFLVTDGGTQPGIFTLPMTVCDDFGRCAVSSVELEVRDATAVAPIAAAFALESSAPNPAHGELALRFTLPDARPATLSLIDVAGRRVATREVGTLGSGHHVVRFADLARLAPGVYLARLEQAGRRASMRVVIAR